jgi:Tfp pilus assembly protein PilF
VSEAFQESSVPSFRSNRANVQAIMLLEKGRIFEAESVLKSALRSDANNPFLLDTLGYVMESEGDLQMASQYYSAAASVHSDERVLLTLKPKWWGKPISEVAAQSAQAVSEILAKGEGMNAHVARLNLRGVSALNHNDTVTAQKCFTEAYSLDPRNAFTINNIGYIAELNGDRETADMYYASARTAMEANERVTFATRSGAEGRKLGSLAETNEEDVESKLKAIQDAKRRSRKPVYLKRRDQFGSVESAPESDSIQPLPRGIQPPPLPSPELPDRRDERNQAPDTRGPSTQPPPAQPSTTSPITRLPTNSQPPDNSQPR